MRNLWIVAGFAALVACGSNEAPGDNGVESGAVQPAEPERAAINASAAEMAGIYELTAEDGTVIRQSVEADGTYTETVDGTQIERGTWHQKGEQMCFDPAGDAIEQCYTGGLPGSDGSFDVEMDAGTASVRRVDETKAADPAAAGADTP